MKVSRKPGGIIYPIPPEKMNCASGGSGVGQQPLGNRFHDLLVDFVDGQVAFDEDDTIGFAGGDFAVFFQTRR